MKNNPLVSIITPAYNCADFILETFNSVVSQTYDNWEWIIINDCSSDNTYELLKEFSEKDKRIIVLKTETNSGAAISRNIGIKKATGQFIAFLDSDDLWDENKLIQQIDYMEKHEISFCYANYYVLKKNGKMLKYSPKNGVSSYHSLLRRNEIGCLTVMYDVSKIGKRFMPLDAEKREDYALWLDITRDGVLAYKIDEFLGTYRLAQNSVSSNKFKMFKYQWMLYRKHEKLGIVKSLFYTLSCAFYKVFMKY